MRERRKRGGAGNAPSPVKIDGIEEKGGEGWVECLECDGEVKENWQSNGEGEGVSANEEGSGEDEEIALSYNEIRQRNIARNEEFLNYLFPDGISSKEMNDDLSKSEIFDHDPSSSKMNIHDLCRQIQHKLPSRSSEMLRIFEYLEQVGGKPFYPSPLDQLLDF